MIFLQRRTPAGVIDDDVDEYPRPERVRGVGELAELINAGRAFVELDERGIHGGQIQRGIRTAETAEARVGRGRRMHGQQMNDPATEPIHDMRQLFGEVAKSPGRRQRGVAERFERLELRLHFVVGSRGQMLGFAEQPRKCAVNRIGGARKVGVDGDAHVRTVGPMLPVFFVEQIGLGLEVADLGQGQFDFPAVRSLLHRQIAPGRIGDDRLPGVRGNDFAPAGGGATQVGAKPGGPVFGRRIFFIGADGEMDFVADKTQTAFAGGRGHDWAGLFHLKNF